MSKSATTPSVGRILHYIPTTFEHINWDDKTQPLVGQILYVHPDGTVDLNVIDQRGLHSFKHHVQILGPLEPKPERKAYAEWMPYQKAVAAGTEQPVQHA